MDPEFWHSKWATNQIGFHQDHPNERLIRHFDRLATGPGARIFVPLCGKTHDIGWLREQGCAVAGVELSELAVTQLFEQLSETTEITPAGTLKRYSAANLDIFVGDFFALAAETLGPVDAVYDRAALIALPAAMRRRYARHMQRLTATAPQLLITLDYEQREMAGPPFAVDAAEVHGLYGGAYRLELLARQDATGSLKKDMHLIQSVWHLAPERE